MSDASSRQGPNPHHRSRHCAGGSAQLTVVGDGAKLPAIQAMVRSRGWSHRVTFIPAVPNDELCAMLPDFDMFAVHTEYWEISKSLLEALLTGLPCIINRRIGQPVPELQGDFVRLVENTSEAYRSASPAGRRMMRRGAGRRAYAHAQAKWSPAVTEAKVVGNLSLASSNASPRHD